MGLPFFQSETTSVPNMYWRIAAGETSAVQTSERGAEILMVAWAMSSCVMVRPRGFRTPNQWRGTDRPAIA